MGDNGFCEKHSRETEMVCPDCNGVKEPMCSICMCEHYKLHHNSKGPAHLTDLIEERLNKIVTPNTTELQKKLKQFDDQTQKNREAKDDLKAKHDEKIEKLKNSFKEWEKLASINHANTLRCHENTYKEIRKCESKLKENLNYPDKIRRTVDELRKKHKYWEGYKEVNKALDDSNKLDYTEITSNLEKYDKLLDEHKKLLAALDDTPGHASEYRQMKEENEQLKRNFLIYLE